LREQLWFLTKFPFNAILKSKITTLIRGQM